MAGKYLITTLGCKVNQYESQQLREVLETFGLRPAAPGDTPLIAVVNTCAVTGSASRKNRQTIRRIARGGRTPVVVTGCGATADAGRLSRLPGVRAVLGHGHDACAELRVLLSNRLGARPIKPPGCLPLVTGKTHSRPDATRYDVSNKRADAQPRREASAPRTISLSTDIIAPPRGVVKTDASLTTKIHGFAGRQRAFLKVQDGCDAFCTYCIIPRLRPNLRSKPIDVAVTEARGLVLAGHKEIIVTGIFLGAYGRGTALRKRWPGRSSPLANLVDALARVDGLKRLRLSSLEPGDVDASLLDVLARHPNCVPHLHLPLQSGSERVLRRMNRQYTRDDFVTMIDRVNAALDRAAISTDIIAGFPGETEGDFADTLNVARRAGFIKIHAFPFSARDGTAAARWQKDFVPTAIARDRMEQLADLERELSLSFRKQFVGQVERVIVEASKGGTGAGGMTDGGATDAVRSGRADRYFEIHFDAAGASTGKYVPVRIDRVTPIRTHGTIVSSAKPGPHTVTRS